MGEQRPMDTLRSFVNSIKDNLQKSDESEKNTIIRSKPDNVSEIYETRRLSLSASRYRPVTDFYEFYWAHNMRDSEFLNIISWLWKIVFTKPSIVPKRLLKVWLTIWVLIMTAILTTTIILSIYDANRLTSTLSAIIGLPTFITLIAFFFKTTFLNTVGDAGRYFTPSPSNISERTNIRSQGISFLKKIHEKVGDEKYDRVIIVAHSLGSVIAYDLLRLLWTEYYKTHSSPLNINQSAINEIEDYIENNSEFDIKQFQKLQYKCWLQQKKIGNKWLVSDLITIGSPLSSADYLIVNNVSLSDLKLQREFPTSPPTADEADNKIHYNSKPYSINTEKRTVKILHHSALFATTRWTNIFFSSDFIGGPIKELFGKAINDIEVKRKSLWFYPGGHTSYWNISSKNAIDKITKALRLRVDSNS